MLMAGFLKKERIGDYLKALSKKAELYIPQKGENAFNFKKYFDGSLPFFNAPTVLPPKHVIYPHSETLFKFSFKKEEGNGGRFGIEIQEIEDLKKRIIFGARPCDIKGFTVIDRVFITTDTPDVYYARRRENTCIATIGCNKPSSGCFCVALKSGPFDEEGSDAFITELNSGFLIEVRTEKGKVLFDEENLEVAEETYFEEKKRKKEMSERLARECFGALEKIEPINSSTKKFNERDFWEKHLSKCISCGLCTYLCPTCYCFNITDEKTTFGGERIRSWDSCMFFHFTLEASGHNPRPDKFLRFRNRVGHKFIFYPERYNGEIACSGCGRCVRFCPVSVDIREIVMKLA